MDEPLHLHLDPFSGLAGDMFLGACLDLGMPLAVIEDAVERLALPGVTVEQRRARRGGFAGCRFRVLVDGEPVEGPDPEDAGHAPPDADAHPHHHSHGHHRHGAGSGHDHGQGHGSGRTLPDIQRLIGASALDPAVRDTALRLFARLGEAEARAHGMPAERVHFHEVGAVDSIVDLVGAAAAIAHLAPARLTSGPVNVGSGHADTEHGRLPVPAPATAHLLTGVPVYGGPGGELLTPTGAVLLAELVDGFGELPAMRLEAVGYGLGRKEVPGRPNAVRLLAGRPLATAGGEMTAGVMVVEAEVDDLPGEGFGFLMERLLAAGALDVFFTPVQMKKSRPGTLVTLLCRGEQLEPLAALLIAESGSLGCRFHPAGRIEAERRIDEVDTAFGRVRVKRASLAGRRLAAAPEYEDCRRLAEASGVPWREVYQAALAAAAK